MILLWAVQVKLSNYWKKICQCSYFSYTAHRTQLKLPSWLNLLSTFKQGITDFSVIRFCKNPLNPLLFYAFEISTQEHAIDFSILTWKRLCCSFSAITFLFRAFRWPESNGFARTGLSTAYLIFQRGRELGVGMGLRYGYNIFLIILKYIFVYVICSIVNSIM